VEEVNKTLAGRGGEGEDAGHASVRHDQHRRDLLIFCIFYMIVVEKTKDIGIIKSVGATSGGCRGHLPRLRAGDRERRQRLGLCVGTDRHIHQQLHDLMHR
jgi:hypothetical protein